MIARREVTRLRQRFSGSASPIAVALLLAVLGLSAFALRSQVSLGSGLYRIGVTADVPPIRDSRFSTMVVDAAQGQALLNRHAIDALIDGAQVIHRADDKSLYAVQALKQYLEQEELARIGAAYPYDQAFPLRVGINYLGPAEANVQTAPGGEAPLARAEEVIIPSLTPPPVPFTQVILALIYILPITFISIFFTSSFMDEKVNRRLTILLSAPITPFQIILGKMLPYASFAFLTTVLIGAPHAREPSAGADDLYPHHIVHICHLPDGAAVLPHIQGHHFHCHAGDRADDGLPGFSCDVHKRQRTGVHLSVDPGSEDVPRGSIWMAGISVPVRCP